MTLIYYRDSGEYSHKDLKSIVRYIDEKRPRLKESFRYIVLRNIQTGCLTTVLVEAGYIGEHDKISKSGQAPEILRLDIGKDYTFSEISTRLIEALKQDEVNIDAKDNSV